MDRYSKCQDRINVLSRLLSKTGTNCSVASSSTYPQCKTSWIHLSQNDLNATSQFEWTITRYGNISSKYYAWSIGSGGNINFGIDMSTTYSVRPVFYLIPSIEVLGSGSITDPYIITN